MERATEYPVLIKSSAERYAELESAIRSRHPYELPEILSWPVERGLPRYLAWIEDETRPLAAT